MIKFPQSQSLVLKVTWLLGYSDAVLRRLQVLLLSLTVIVCFGTHGQTDIVRHLGEEPVGLLIVLSRIADGRDL